MFVGGMTQFLSKAQGIPKNIESTLTKSIRRFIWDGTKTPPISLEQMQKPQEEGGINLLDISTQNQVIIITWLRDYLNLSSARLTLAFIVDTIINYIKPEGLKDVSDINTLLTSWTPFSQGPNMKKIPLKIISMLKAAKKYCCNENGMGRF
ncbi:hypothetical protein BDR03DRAFT_984460 [Suillus americanus]|nr:hypothetical protein BDR03DRAFT_984460 [Suillus americanus]